MAFNEFLLGVCALVVVISFHVCEAGDSGYPIPDKEWLHEHNEARSGVGVPSLHWNETLVHYAQNHANKLVESCELKYSKGPYGENLLMTDKSATAKSVVNGPKSWMAEKANYDYDNHTCKRDTCGHYTQLVWRNSTQVGCAQAVCHDGKQVATICSYYPPGNYKGQKPF